MVLDGLKYLVTVDYFSKFIEVNNVSDEKSATVINVLKQQFARYGIPEEIISDNGQEFASYEFKSFSRAYHIEHTTSSPRYPQSNGLAKRSVQTVKRLFKKARDDGKDPYLALMELRNIPITGIELSPSQLLLGRATRTTLPAKRTQLNPLGFEPCAIKSSLEEQKARQK
ncbi:uncharacterized protein K02A2.6-like, partial [Mizuhopecten yessoensis]|uniref:uncharacterized protein K02A2.6-like n=1 Tax=Mizuhopecten yessoensis TaxID=6573 RepID=UPI000B45720C